MYKVRLYAAVVALSVMGNVLAHGRYYAAGKEDDIKSKTDAQFSYWVKPGMLNSTLKGLAENFIETQKAAVANELCNKSYKNEQEYKDTINNYAAGLAIKFVLQERLACGAQYLTSYLNLTAGEAPPCSPVLINPFKTTILGNLNDIWEKKLHAEVQAGRTLEGWLNNAADVHYDVKNQIKQICRLQPVIVVKHSATPTPIHVPHYSSNDSDKNIHEVYPDQKVISTGRMSTLRDHISAHRTFRKMECGTCLENHNNMPKKARVTLECRHSICPSCLAMDLHVKNDHASTGHCFCGAEINKSEFSFEYLLANGADIAKMKADHPAYAKKLNQVILSNPALQAIVIKLLLNA